MAKHTLLMVLLVVCSLSMAGRTASAQDEYKEAIQQTEDEWQAVRSTLKESQEALGDLQKKYEEYRAAAFSDSPEKGLELARILFKLDKNDTKAAAAKVKAMRDMFTKLDRAGVTDKIESTSQYLEKANGYAGQVENVWEFTKKFNPDHAKDNPTYGLRLIGTLLTESAGKMESIPLVGQVLGKWVKAYGEVAGDFANSLDRLGKQIDEFRGGSLCGQLGKRQDQQAAFNSTGRTDCLTHFATGIFPRLRGEAYEGDSDYFLYDPATKRGYIASKNADKIYRWHGLLLEPRALYPDWLAGRANSLQPEAVTESRARYRLFHGWATKSETDWLVIDKLGLFQNAYYYGQLDEDAFVGNDLLDGKAHKAIRAILEQYDKYIVISGTVREEFEARDRPAAAARVEFDVDGARFSQTTGNDGRFEVLIEARINDRISEAITKDGFETITSDGRIPGKVITGLDYVLERDGAAIAPETGAAAGAGLGAGDPGFNIGALVIEPGLESSYTGTRFAVGDPVRLRIDVTDSPVGPSLPLSTEWQVIGPDGVRVTTQASRLYTAEGVSGSMSCVIRRSGSVALGVYQVTAVISLRDEEVARRNGTFEVRPLFDSPELLLTDSEDGTMSLAQFRPADPLFALAKMNYNSVDPNRQVHLSVDFAGPDPGISALGVEADQTYEPGPMLTGVSQRVPDVVQEGQYTVTVTLDGGHGQRVALQGGFQIIYPVHFDGIWTLNGLTPPEVKSRFMVNDPCEWFMRYEFTDARPGDEYYSALWCHYGEMVIEGLGSEKMGPDVPSPGTATSSFQGVIPSNMPSATYEVNGAVWYNGVAYSSPGTSLKVGQEPTIAITSPGPAFVTDEKVMTVTGTCADQQLTQAQLLTNGEAIPIKLQDGKFSAKTVLRPGLNQIEVVAENDVGRGEDSVYGTANIKASTLKIVLTWEAPSTDVDLWVTDPEGVVTSYQHKHPAEGRKLDVDITSGPGMETYTVEVALRGQYEVAVHYFGAGSWQGPVPFDLQITTWETTYNEGREHLSGTLYNAAQNRDEAGAVERFSVYLR